MSAADGIGSNGQPGVRPVALAPEFPKIPAELKSLPKWVLWRYMPPRTPGKKWRKVPFQTNGTPASSTDHSTWSSFEQCCAAYTRGGFDGVGFVFDGEIGADGFCYCGVGFDACIEKGKLQSLARGRMERLKTYTEGSVSRTGIHCIARAKPLDRIVKFDGVEIYTTARYFTFTGYSSGEIKDAPAEINALVEEVRAKEAAAKKQQHSGRISSTDLGLTKIPTAEEADVIIAPNLPRPAQAFARLDISKESLAEGIKDYWLERLPRIKKMKLLIMRWRSLRKIPSFLRLRRTVATMPNGTR